MVESLNERTAVEGGGGGTALDRRQITGRERAQERGRTLEDGWGAGEGKEGVEEHGRGEGREEDWCWREGEGAGELPSDE